jgi:hypothetical protein
MKIFSAPLLLIFFVAIAVSTTSFAQQLYPFSSSTSYTHHLRIKNLNNAPLDFFWAVSGIAGAKRFHFAIASNRSDTNWIGIGISEPAATMPGADIGVGVFQSQQQVVFTDYFARGFEQPIPDPVGDRCVSQTITSASSLSSSATSPQQGWKTVGGFKNGTHTLIEGYREFRGADPHHDRSLSENVADVSRFIFALGPQSQMSYHGQDNWQCRVRLFSTTEHLIGVPAPAELNPVMASGLPYFFVGMGSGHTLLPQVTHYIDSPCVAIQFNGSAIGNGGVFGAATQQSNITAPSFIVGFTNQVHGPTARFVHHLVLKGWPTETCNSGISTDIFGTGYDPNTYYQFPADVSLNIGRFRGISVEFHYHNPSLETGRVDFSGVRMYYETTPRAHSASILQIADPAVRASPSTVPMGVSRFDFWCPSSCTSRFPRPITVFGIFQHMHSAGIEFQNSFFREGALEPYFARKAEYYDYHDQRFFNLPEPIVIQPGDRLKTSCTYKTLISGKVFGLGSEDEMCIAFLYYYEDLPTNLIVGQYCGVSICGTQEPAKLYSSESELGREFGTGVCASSAGNFSPFAILGINLFFVIILFSLSVVL